MAYIPPADRENSQQSSSDSPSGALHHRTNQLEETFSDLTLTKSARNPTALFADIHKHYWAPKSVDGDDSSSPPATQPIILSHSTLNGSAMQPDKLQYVMLFKDANPRWVSDGIIFVKSSLHLLPGYEQAKSADASSVISTGSIASKKSNTQEPMAQKEEKEDKAMDSQVCGENQRASGKMIVADEIDAHKKAEPADEQQRLTKKETERQNPEVFDTNLQKSPPAPLSTQQDDDPDDSDATKPKGDAEVTSTATSTSYSPDLFKYDTGPIAIFEQATKRQDGHFRFSGYYKITNLQYLPPQSADLYRMLEQKFSTMDRFGRWKQRTRSAASWNASMSLMWAVIKMERDEEADARLEPPALTRARAAES